MARNMKVIRTVLCCFAAVMMWEQALSLPAKGLDQKPAAAPHQCNCPNSPVPRPSQPPPPRTPPKVPYGTLTPPPCGRDQDCPAYFAPSCGYFNGQIMIFAGDCFMDNYNCRTGSNYVTIPLSYCTPRLMSNKFLG